MWTGNEGYNLEEGLRSLTDDDGYGPDLKYAQIHVCRSVCRKTYVSTGLCATCGPL